MSKIGQKKINIPDTVKLEITKNVVNATGPKGELTVAIPANIKVSMDRQLVSVTRAKEDKKTKSLHGLIRKLIENIVVGVSEGFEKKLDFKGIGFRAEVAGKTLTLFVGFSHPVKIVAPEEIEIKVEKNIITVSGIDRQKVGQVAANIRAVKPVEPYKGKGIKYIDEIPRRKAGKAAKAAIGAGA